MPTTTKTRHLRARPDTAIAEAMIYDIEPYIDSRGTFACIYEAACGLFSVAEINLSGTLHAGTLRGLHYSSQAKILLCVQGTILDIGLDVRRESPTYGKHTRLLMNGESGILLYLPPGVAHGFQVLQGPATLLYLTSVAYDAKEEKGILWNDPTFALPWDYQNVSLVSEKDRAWDRWSI